MPESVSDFADSGIFLPSPFPRRSAAAVRRVVSITGGGGYFFLRGAKMPESEEQIVKQISELLSEDVTQVLIQCVEEASDEN